MNLAKIVELIIAPVVMALLGYIFSIHIEFIQVKNQVSQHEKNFEAIEKTLDRIDGKIDHITSKLIDK